MKTRLLLTICFTVITICLPNCKPVSVEPPSVQIVQPVKVPSVQAGDAVNVHLMISSSMPLTSFSVEWVYGVNKVPCSPKTTYVLDDVLAVERAVVVMVPEITDQIVAAHDVFIEIEVFTHENSKKEYIRVDYLPKNTSNEVVYMVSQSASDFTLRSCASKEGRVVFQKFNATVLDAVFYQHVALLHTSAGLLPVDSSGNVRSFHSEPASEILGIALLDQPYLLYPEQIVAVDRNIDRTQSFVLPSNTKPFAIEAAGGELLVLSSELSGGFSLTKLNVRSGSVLHHEVVQGRSFSAVITEPSGAFFLFEDKNDGTGLVRFTSQNTLTTMAHISQKVAQAMVTSSGTYILTKQGELYAFDTDSWQVKSLLLSHVSTLSKHPNGKAFVALDDDGVVYEIESSSPAQIAIDCEVTNAAFVAIN